jgi:hypothetical protein
VTQRVAERIANITRSQIRYFEPFQVLKYEVGQFYKVHHDQNSGLFTPQGARVYTFFMYLSTPEAGGGTRFANLDHIVPAVKGNAVLWPSIMNDDPTKDEPLTNHEALPVTAGRKCAFAHVGCTWHKPKHKPTPSCLSLRSYITGSVRRMCADASNV